MKTTPLFLLLLLSACATVPKDIGYGPYGYWITDSGNIAIQIDHPSGYECENDMKASWAQNKANGYTSRCGNEDQHALFRASLGVEGQTGPTAAIKIWFRTMDECHVIRQRLVDYVAKSGNGHVSTVCTPEPTTAP